MNFSGIEKRSRAEVSFETGVGLEGMTDLFKELG